MKFKKQLCIGLSSIMLFATVTPTLAQEINSQNYVNVENSYLNSDFTTKILQDDDNIRIVETIDSKSKYTATYNKKDRTLDIIVSKINSSNRILETTEKYHIDFEKDAIKDRIYQNTFSNYEYTKRYGNPNVWELRRPDPSNPFFKTIGFSTKETSANVNYLYKYMDYVEKINSKEINLLASLGSALLSDVLVAMSGVANIFSGGTLTPAMIQTIATSLGANGVLLYDYQTLIHYYNMAYDNYCEVYYKRS